MKLLVLYSLPPTDLEAARNLLEFDLSEPVRGLAEVLPQANIVGVRGDPVEVMTLLASHQPDVVFNACEAPFGRTDLEAQFAALLELAGVRFTGSRSYTLALCRRKDHVKAVLAAAGVRVPRSHVFPCIVKPADEDGSFGIHPDSICEDEKSMSRACQRLTSPILVEEFLPGREFAVYLWGAREPDSFSVGETCFQGDLRLNTYAAKWDVESSDFANSPVLYDIDVTSDLFCEVIETARTAWRVVEANGYLSVDVRLSADGRPCVIDVNPNPELYPGSGINLAVTSSGWTWEQFIKQQIEWA
jgi:D-alanine-D-alanine ligase